MEDIESAARSLSLDPKWLQEFDVADPFNDAALRGFLSGGRITATAPWPLPT